MAVGWKHSPRTYSSSIRGGYGAGPTMAAEEVENSMSQDHTGITGEI